MAIFFHGEFNEISLMFEMKIYETLYEGYTHSLNTNKMGHGMILLP